MLSDLIKIHVTNSRKVIIEMYRNDLFWVDLTPYSKENSSIQSSIRPCIIISNNLACKHSPVILVSPITSKLSKNRLPTHVTIGRESGLSKDSIVLLEQVITVDRKSLGDYIGTVPLHKVCEIDKALIISGGINIEQQTTNVIDKGRIDNLISLIKDTEKKIEKTNDEYFDKMKRGLLSELKNYCKQCGANYSIIIKNNNIVLDDIYYDKVCIAR
jgi:mRNA interferase MazF